MAIFNCVVSRVHERIYSIDFIDSYENIIRHIFQINIGRPGDNCILRYRNLPDLECVIHRHRNDIAWISTNTRNPHYNSVTLYKFLTNIGLSNPDHIQLEYLGNNTFRIV